MDKSVKHLMSIEVVSVNPEQTIHDALNEMRKHEIRHLPVVTRRKGKLVGLLSEGDVLLYLQKNGTALEVDERVLVGDAMSKEVVYCYPNSKVVNVAATMITAKIDSVPIIEPSTNKLVGIVTTTDLLDDMCLAFELNGGSVRPLKYNNPNNRLQKNVRLVGQ